MTRGILEVLLVDACLLKDTDLVGKMDPYVVIKFGDQKRKSTVSRTGQGKTPVWNEKLKLDVEYAGNIRDEHPQYKLSFKIMDKDRFSKNDFVGELTIYVDDLLAQGMVNGKAEIPPCNYSVVGSNQSDNGGIRVGLAFTPNQVDEYGNEEDKSEEKKHRFHLHHKNDGEKKSGGWKNAFKHHNKNDGEAEEEAEREGAESESVSESDQEEEAEEAGEEGEEEGNVFEKLGALLESLGGL
ncbi:elicitor-responsive protein 1-like isoform X1 [Papaver somniferum]|uniref:elicitor-responsive protein 1-like isoform X1 n=1 Tax=Papaver somniferum TaxID=3469 RepID=UPI000E70147D|nr:elicitor-responsive protein 1-like isoform X1 [Papaver somniferum]